MNIQIGSKIRSFRLAKSMTQEQLAQKLGMSAQAVSKWESSTNMPDIQMLLVLSVTLPALYLGSIQLDRITTSRFIPRAMAQYKSFLFSKISRKSIAAFCRENTATYLSAITNDTKTIQMGVGDLFIICNCLLRMLFATCLMLWYSPAMTLGVLTISALFFLLSIPTGNRLVQAEQALPLQLADLNAASILIRKAADSLEKNIRDEGAEIPPVLEQGVELRDLCFSYEPGKPVLRGIRYRFEAGKRYALVGSSGCGKSTLLHLLMGGHAYKGNVLIDNRELQEINSHSLYGIASIISQNVFLFNATILENITMFRDFPRDHVQEAAKLSGLLQVIEEKGSALPSPAAGTSRNFPL